MRSILTPSLNSGARPVRARIVDLLLTYDCNSQCPYCFLKGHGHGQAMTPSILDRSIDWIVETSDGEVEVVFLGGEPTLEPELIERAVLRARRWQALKPLKFSFSMTTNCLRIDEPMARLLAGLGVKCLVSVDGAGERHDRSRPSREVDSPYRLIASRLPGFLKHQPHLGARVTTIPANVPWLEEDLHELQRLGFRHFIVSPATGIHWSDEALEAFVTQLTGYALSRKQGGGPFPEPRLQGIDNAASYPGCWGCGAGHGRFSIDPMGRIFACARFCTDRPADGDMVLGTVFSGIDLDGNITRFLELQDACRPLCEACDIRDRCLGGCPSVNLDETGSLAGPSANECRFNRAMDRIRQRIATGNSGNATKT